MDGEPFANKVYRIALWKTACPWKPTWIPPTWIRERTLAGLSAARARGRVGGRKPKLTEKQIREIKALLSDPAAQVNDIAKRHGLSRTTLYKRVGVVQSIKVL